MSQLETNPLANPTTENDNPTQLMEVLPAAVVPNLRFDPPGLVRTQGPNIKIEQLDWIKIAEKNKFIKSFQWNVNNDSAWFNQEFDYNLVQTLTPVAWEINTYSNFNSLLMSIKPTNNAFFMGLTGLFFDPAPHINYYNNLFGIDAQHLTRIWQFRKVMISPKDSGEINFLVPINFPFEMFKNRINRGPLYLRNVSSYLQDYPFGRLRSKPLTDLHSTSDLTALHFVLSGQVLDLETGGIRIEQAF